jgi:hypothetical protein
LDPLIKSQLLCRDISFLPNARYQFLERRICRGTYRLVVLLCHLANGQQLCRDERANNCSADRPPSMKDENRLHLRGMEPAIVSVRPA